ncbi:hypothetical protein PSRE111525_10605 [Pseudomonas reidholzensis]
MGVSCIELNQLIDHHWHRPAIGNDVVQGQHQDMLVRRQTQQARAQQWAQLQVEWPLGLGLHTGTQTGIVSLLKRLDGQLERNLWVDHLHRLLPLQSEGGAQRFVAGNHCLEAALQGSDIQVSLEAQD